MKLKVHRPLEGDVKCLIVKRDTIGNWYACFVMTVEPHSLEPSPYAIGIDLGLTTFATLAHGQAVENPRFFRRDEKALAKAGRKLSACTKGSPPWHKAKRVVQHIHQRIAKRRRDFAHQESHKLLATYQIIWFEELRPSNMVQTPSLTKSISDAAWNQLVQYTTYKAASAGRTVVLVDPRYTSQDCSGCGERVKKSLSVRVHRRQPLETPRF